MMMLVRYVFFISSFFLIAFYLLTVILFKSFSKNYFAINLIFGYVIMFINFVLIVRSAINVSKNKIKAINGVFRFLFICFLIFLWIKFMPVNIFGLISSIILFTLLLPVSSVIYIRRV